MPAEREHGLSGAIEKVQRLTPRGAECRLTHVKGFTGPLCHCPPLRCKAVPLEELAAVSGWGSRVVQDNYDWRIGMTPDE